ncbi:DUF169 domain-containing protein [Methanobrevibacter sp. TMH8]|uniref:DUF169 domain-containing protein n=1 Tax=Methanobrevibacter sp. TMH8 TaxID=2848611 RepID=UPI001CCCC849|nr:DUF169 domain-containing protein [Methanobrevibacter sp. TMH8]MBZ9570901.1 DUF169 domain-containing protein [Methanobrevibacter sp. TMH8]
MEESIKTNELENNQYFSQMLKEDLNIKTSPVAIKFILHKEDIPQKIEKIGEKMRHCEMVQKAANGAIFYSTSSEQLCKGGSAAIGLEKLPEKLDSGEFYYNLGRFKSLGSAKRTIDSVPKINLNVYAIIYMPLEKADFIPDVVVIIGSPVQAMKITQAIVYTLGGRVESDFSGIQSVCADAVARPFISKRANITMGCSGSRQNADIKNEELIIGLNGENLGCTVNALNSI